jgi:hypothetical protein
MFTAASSANVIAPKKPDLNGLKLDPNKPLSKAPPATQPTSQQAMGTKPTKPTRNSQTPNVSARDTPVRQDNSRQNTKKRVFDGEYLPNTDPKKKKKPTTVDPGNKAVQNDLITSKEYNHKGGRVSENSQTPMEPVMFEEVVMKEPVTKDPTRRQSIQTLDKKGPMERENKSGIIKHNRNHSAEIQVQENPPSQHHVQTNSYLRQLSNHRQDIQFNGPRSEYGSPQNSQIEHSQMEVENSQVEGDEYNDDDFEVEDEEDELHLPLTQQGTNSQTFTEMVDTVLTP